MFLAPAFLFGLLAIGVPLWLHRVAKANPTRHQFPSLMLLEASETQRTARRTLRYWLLLALRILMLIALVLAFAGLLAPQQAQSIVGANSRLHAIVLDTSYSMQYGDRWQRAVAQVEEILRGLSGGDRVMLVNGAGRRIQVLQSAVPASDAGQIRAALRTLEPGIDRLDFGLLMTTANGWLGEPRPATELHLISDLQQSASPLRFADLAPPPNTTIVLHDVSEDAVNNAFIENAALTATDSRTLEVRIGHSPATMGPRTVVLSVEGKEVARQIIELAPVTNGPGAVTVQFEQLELGAGTHRMEVRLEPTDGLPQDDRFFAVIEHASPKVLLISRNERADEAAYFAAAIESLSSPRLAVERVTVSAAESRTLSDYAAVVVADSSALSSVAAQRLRDYVSNGGALLATLGAAGSGERGEALTGLRITGVRNQAASVASVDTSHPTLRDASDWHSVRFFRFAQLQPAADDRVLLALNNGAPLLLERASGAGRMLLLTAPLDRAWNDLAVHPLFVRFIAEIARYLTGQDALTSAARVGTSVLTGLTAATGGQIFDPQGNRVLALGGVQSVERLIPDQTGFYEVRGGQGARWIAVNIDARESDLPALSADSVQRWQSLQSTAPATTATEPSAAAASDSRDDQSRSLGYVLLLLAAALVLAEFLLGNHYLSVRREVPG